MWVRPLSWMQPTEAASRYVGFAGLALLDSAMAHPDLGRFSYLVADPFGRFTVRGTTAFWNGTALLEPPLEALRARLSSYPSDLVGGLPPFQGGAVGLFAYEFGWMLEGRSPPVPSTIEEVDLAFHDVVLAFDHASRACWLIASGHPGRSGPERQRRAIERLDVFTDRLSRPAPSSQPVPTIRWRPTTSRDTYRQGIGRVKGFILAGDIYQANLSQRFTAALPSCTEPWSLYQVLRQANPAPFAAYLDCGARQILSTSPELFLRADGRHVETRPIKGTARASPDATADAAIGRRLLSSRKDRAENVMIVDLLRNDLSRVCTPASVTVPELCVLETYSGLHHLVSAVTGDLKPEADALDLLAAAFPGGSITGAPKLRAMEIIAAIEGEARGAYCGAIGAIGFDGSVVLNIAIRTLVIEDGRMDLRSGGGITFLSDADEEYEETLTKAHRFFEAFGAGPLAAAS